jgi:hypothetical protein
MNLTLGRLLCRTNMRVMNLGRKFETRDRFLEMRLQRGHHDEHESFGVSTEGVLEEVCQLQIILVHGHSTKWVHRVCLGLPSSSDKEYACPPSSFRAH